MTKKIVCNGRPGAPDHVQFSLGRGQEPMQRGDERLITDSYANAYGFENGDDFATYMGAVENDQRGTLFTVADATDDDVERLQAEAKQREVIRAGLTDRDPFLTPAIEAARQASGQDIFGPAKTTAPEPEKPVTTTTAPEPKAKKEQK